MPFWDDISILGDKAIFLEKHSSKKEEISFGILVERGAPTILMSTAIGATAEVVGARYWSREINAVF
jgi:hypothetical protein